MEIRLQQLEEENRALQIKDKQFRKLVENNEYAYVLLEADLITDCNNQAELFFGCSRKKLIHTSIFNFFPDDPVILPSVKNEFSKLINEIHVKDNSFIWKFKHNEQLTEANVYASHIENSNNKNISQLLIKPVTTVIKTETPTKKKDRQFSKSRHLYESLILLFNNMRDGFIQTDLEGRFLQCNEAFCNIVDYSEEELKKLSTRKITPAKWQQFEQRIIQEQVLKQGFSNIYEKEYKRKDGTNIPVEIQVYLIKEGNKPVGFWGIARDMSDLKKYEHELRESQLMLQSVLNTIPVSVFWKDRNLKCRGSSLRVNIMLMITLLSIMVVQ